jgi:hypothetical protein
MILCPTKDHFKIAARFIAALMIAMLLPGSAAFGQARRKRTKTAGEQPDAAAAINTDARAASIYELILRLARQSQLNVIFDSSTLKKCQETKIDFQLGSVAPLKAINILLDAYDLSYAQVDRRAVMIIDKSRFIGPIISLEDLMTRADKLDQLGKEAIKRDGNLKRDDGFRFHDYSFRDARLDFVIRTIADQVRLNVIFEDAVEKLAETKKVNFDIKGVTAPRALLVLLNAQRFIYNQVDRRTIMISPAAKANYSFSSPLEEIIRRTDEDEMIPATSPASENTNKANSIERPSVMKAQPQSDNSSGLAADSSSIYLLLRVINPQMSVGQVGLMGIIVSSGRQLQTAQLSLRFNPKVIKITAVQDGRLLTLSGVGKFDYQLTEGSVSISIIRPSEAKPVPAAGQLALIYFQGIGAGSADLNISEAQLSDEKGNPIPLTITNGNIEVFNSKNSGVANSDEN